MNAALDFLPVPHRLLAGPLDVGCEQRFVVLLADGQRAVVGQLAPDLARDASIRGRYLRDLERIRGLRASSLAPTLATGPAPEHADAVAPWRMRLDPEGYRLLDALHRAPLPLDEVALWFSGLADAVHEIHEAGAILRDLRPEHVVRTRDGRTILTDVGLARVDVLSSHTASSLLLQRSSHAAPELLLRNSVDQRADLYSLGVLLWHALTGALPFGDGPPLLTERHPLPDLRLVRPEAPVALDRLVRQCLAEDPRDRPGSATEVAWVLRGGSTQNWLEEATVQCQHCHARLRVGQRLCVGCGRVAVRFAHAGRREPGYAVDLLSLREDAKPLRWLQDLVRTISNGPVGDPQFLIGPVHMYAEEERQGRIRLPARLYADLTRDSAETLAGMMRAQGLRARVVSPTEARRAGVAVAGSIAGTVGGAAALGFLGLSPWFVIVPGIALIAALLARWNDRVVDRRKTPSFTLRPTPAALPASDSLVARLADLLQRELRGDVREIVGELALVVQRLVDHRARLHQGVQEVVAWTEPLEPLVRAVEAEVQRLEGIDRALATLDEGTLVRALAASEARGEPLERRAGILAGLDRLRVLEDERSAVFHRLLEAQALLQRTVNLGLSVHDPVQEHERHLQLALATLQCRSLEEGALS